MATAETQLSRTGPGDTKGTCWPHGVDGPVRSGICPRGAGTGKRASKSVLGMEGGLAKTSWRSKGWCGSLKDGWGTRGPATGTARRGQERQKVRWFSVSHTGPVCQEAVNTTLWSFTVQILWRAGGRSREQHGQMCRLGKPALVAVRGSHRRQGLGSSHRAPRRQERTGPREEGGRVL